MAEQPENIVIEHLRGLRRDVGDIKGEMQTLKASDDLEMATKSDLQSLRADVASDMLTMQKETRDQIVGLRRAVIEYHSAVVDMGSSSANSKSGFALLTQHLDIAAVRASLKCSLPVCG